MTNIPSGPPDFDDVYRQDDDPWDVSSSWYERRKLEVLLASLPREHYATGWEPGCGPGFTSPPLASHVSQLVCSDGSAVAIARAKERCAELRQVRCVVSSLPEVPVETRVELIVVAEFLYYVPEFHRAVEALWSTLATAGHLVFLHWRHHPHDAYRSGEQMHAEIREDAVSRRGAQPLVHHLDADFVLDIYGGPF